MNLEEEAGNSSTGILSVNIARKFHPYYNRFPYSRFGAYMESRYAARAMLFKEKEAREKGKNDK